LVLAPYVARESTPVQVSLRTGLNDPHLLEASLAGQRERRLDAIQRAGATWVRFDVQWEDLQPAAHGPLDRRFLGDLDELIAGVAQRGLRAIAILERAPCWAVRRGALCGDRGNSPPADARDYGTVLAALATRYAMQPVVWEMWNEPNLDYFFDSSDNARDYTALIRSAYPMAKAAAPGVTFLAGALSLADDDFLASMYRHGAKGHFDAVSVHPYSSSVIDDSSPYGLRLGVPAARATMLAHRDDKPIWLTELGWSSTGRDTEQVQGRRLAQAYEMIAQWPYVAAAVWYETADARGAGSDGFGLYRANWTPKPAFEAFRAASRGPRHAG
jgi:Cellulase (glycosyl hydrolase family 5)